ncbi:UvrD-helicase domain-containing protein [Flavobacterium foetidum]|uniref:UvrD-helicase domain-containing protein n=1 Tax=Flavobacterium foetidum TaxID=2026681 RepID=UPI0010757742|nr:UvrD-helicase domain-containing protein [Flavobacterium foetidum]KAF2517060.1 ATP-dependent helicase [Flavobacterium foetidum]
MAEGRLEKVERKDEFQLIMELIRKGDNFLLSGGAGSGKTYSLVQVIKKVIEEFPTVKVACMTYTNSAVKEIEERVNHESLNVTTIHDFLWDNIKNYQKELKKVLIELINDEAVDKIELINNQKVGETYYDGIEEIKYSYQSVQLPQGIISHDELLLLANRMFKNSKLLCDIVKDKFKFIFIDEYQDTHKEVVEIFLDHLNKSKKQNIIGFFGDAMQSIYDDGIGNLDVYLKKNKVVEVKKIQNRRNPKLVYELANKLRTDGIQQTHSNDENAPNMNSKEEVKLGDIKFIYSKHDDLEKVKTYLGWDFKKFKETKELNLTHNLNAKKGQFTTLMDIYNNDKILEYKNNIVKHLKNSTDIVISDDDTFGEVIEKVKLPMTGPISSFISLNPLLFTEAKNYKFVNFRRIYLSSEILTDDKKQDEDDEAKKGSKRDHLLKHLFKIQNNIKYYKDAKYLEFLKETDYKAYLKENKLIFNIEQKKVLKTNIDKLINVGNKTIEEVINEAHEMGICMKSYNLLKFQTEKAYAYNRIKKVSFSEFQNVYNYLEGLTNYSTQHKVKGDEFDNVLVILDNGNWNKYNFEYVFDSLNQEKILIEGKSKTKSKLTSFYNTLPRTQKIFYVCCTRAKNKLAVYYQSPSSHVISTAEKWFGVDNVINLDAISIS